VWELDRIDVVWGIIRVRRRIPGGQFEHWCIIQVTNANEAHRGEQMPQLGACNMEDRFQQWGFTYGLDFSLVPNDTLVHVPEIKL